MRRRPSRGQEHQQTGRRALLYLRSRLGTSFARSIGALWTGEILVLVIGAIQAIALARLLTPSQLGTLTLAFAVPAFIFAIVDAQSQEAVTRFIAEFRARGRADRARAVVALAVKVDLALMALGVAITLILAPWILDTFLDHEVSAALLGVAAFGIAVGLPASTAIAILMADVRSGLVASSRSFGSVLQSVAVIVTVWAGGGVSGAIVASTLSSTAGLLLVAWLASSTMRHAFGGRWERSSSLGPERARVLRFIAFTNGSSLIATMAKDMDVLVLGYLTGTRQVGFYRVARSVSRVSTFLIGPLQALTYNRFAKLVAEGDLSRLRSQVSRSLREVGIPLAGVICATLVLAPQLIRVTATATYAPAIGPLRWLIFAGAFLTATFWVRPLLLALDEVRFLLTATIATTALAVPFYFLLTHLAQASGTASARALITGVVGTGVSALWGVRSLRRRMADVAPSLGSVVSPSSKGTHD